MAVKNSKGNKREEGQALFEMIAFLPVLILLYTIMFHTGNSINVSINQNKTTRRYFYYLAKGNSLLPIQSELMAYTNGFVRLGISMVGYAEKRTGETPMGSCFKFNSFFVGDDGETCEDSKKGAQETAFVRVFTTYGICGENYFRRANRWDVGYSNGPGDPDPKSEPGACAAKSLAP